MRLKNGEIFQAQKKPTSYLPMAELIDKNNVFNPLAKKIFVDWFYKFSENEMMTQENCAAFIHSCTSN